MIVPIVVAFLAGNLATLNPCGFAMLPGFLSFYLGTSDGADQVRGGRLGEGLIVGGLVTAGFVGVFAVLAIPLSFGATALAAIFPWAGLMVGLALVVLGTGELAGHHLLVRLPGGRTPRMSRSPREIVLFGAGYALASLSCTLPTFLALTASSFAARGPLGSALVLLSYTAGTATILGGLSIAAALVKDGFTRGLRRLLPVVGRASAILLIGVGVYLVTYWVTALTGASSLAANPIFSIVTTAASGLQTGVGSPAGRWLALFILVSIGIAAGVAARRLRRLLIESLPIQRRKAL